MLTIFCWSLPILNGLLKSNLKSCNQGVFNESRILKRCSSRPTETKRKLETTPTNATIARQQRKLETTPTNAKKKNHKRNERREHE